MDPQTLSEAYSRGIFPWPQRNGEVLWISPIRRGVLRFSEYHFFSRLRRFARNSDWTSTFNRKTRDVILACQKSVRTGQDFTWITDNILDAYSDLAAIGQVHSVECWSGDGTLIGGAYGVWNGRAFTGESMFFLKPNASKLALAALISELNKMSLPWIDIQIVSNYMGTVGGRLVERAEYYRMLDECQPITLVWPERLSAATLSDRIF